MKPFLKGLIAAAIVFVIGAGGWITYDYLIPKQVTVIIETLEQTQQINAEVKAQNVADSTSFIISSAPQALQQYIFCSMVSFGSFFPKISLHSSGANEDPQDPQVSLPDVGSNCIAEPQFLHL